MKFIQFTPSEIQESLDYWTDERMENAMPAPLLQADTPKENEQKDNEFSKAEEEMFLWGSQGSSFAPSYPVRVDVDSDPYKKAGKLYFVQNNASLWATAQLVGKPNILLTAAHCVKEPFPYSEWSSKIIFRRASEDTSSPHVVTVPVSSIVVHDNWDISCNVATQVRWDYAFAKISYGAICGHLSLSTEVSQHRYIRAIGYQRNYDNMGRYMYEAKGYRGMQRNGKVHMLGNPMKHGSSGGAWFPRDSNDIIGLNSFIDKGNGNMYGPVFDKHTIKLLKSMKNSLKSCQIM